MKTPKSLITGSAIALVMILCSFMSVTGGAAEGQTIGKNTYKGWIGNSSAILMMLEN